MKESCVIVGAGTYGQIYAEYLKETYNIIGFIDDNPNIHGQVVNGLPVIGDMSCLLNKISKEINVFIPIGNNKVRSSLLDLVSSKGFKTPNYIHPTVNIESSVKISQQAVYILQGTIIMPLVKIDSGVMISSGSIISHHTVIEKGVFISFGVNVGASICLCENAYLGIGSLVMTGVNKVGRNSLIGAGAVIIRDVPDGATVVGNPGRIIKQVDVSE